MSSASASAVYAASNTLFDAYMKTKQEYNARCMELYAEYAALKEEFDSQPEPADDAGKEERARAEKKLVGASFVLVTMNLDTRVGVTD